MTKELQKIEDSDSMTLNFVTYSDNELSVIDLDNAEIEDLTSINAQRKMERETVTQQFVLPQEVLLYQLGATPFGWNSAFSAY